MTFVLDSILIIVLSSISLNLLAEISPQLSEFYRQDYWLYWWIIQLATALGYHYVAWSIWQASPMQHFLKLKLVDANEKNLSTLQFLFRLLFKTLIINIPLFISVSNHNLFLLSCLIYLGILLIASKIIYESPKGQMIHGILTDSHLIYLPEKTSSN